MKANNILVVDGDSYGRAIADLGTLTSDLRRFIREPETFKLILFTGGSDISPSFYNETSPTGLCSSNSARDRKERLIFKRALRAGIKMTGICRGSQFLNVMAGGRIIHHLNGHGIWGTHPLACSENDKIIQVNSLHHQMIIPPPNGYIIAWCPDKLSDVYYGNGDLLVKWPGPEVEGIYLPRIQACAVQWHPEAMCKKSDGFIFYNKMVGDFLEMPTKKFSDKYTGRAKAKNKIGII